MIRISVVAPVYNVEQYIRQFLSSIEKQSMDNVEFIIIDDGSTDNSYRIIEEYAKRDKRCKVFHQENKGVSAARNQGLKMAIGEYVYIVDSDDWLEDDALRYLWNEAEYCHADVIYGMHYLEDGAKSQLRGSFPNRFYTTDKKTISEIQCALSNNNVIRTTCPEFTTINGLGGAPWKAMFKRCLITDNKIVYNENLRSLGEDILFWQEVFEHVGSVSYIEKPIYHYRKSTNSLSHGYKSNLLDIYEKVFIEEEKFLGEKDKSEQHWEAYYFRILIYIRQSVDYYYKNKLNTKSESERYAAFVEMVKREPFSVAINSVRVKKIVSLKTRLGILFLRFKLFRLYWIMI